MQTMRARERFHAIASFQPFDRLPLLEWAGWWNKTIERWHGEGLPVSITDRYEICRHFGLDLYHQDWIRARTAQTPPPAAHGAPIITTMAEYEAIRPTLYPEGAIDPAYWEKLAALQAEGDTVLWFTLDGFFWFPRQLLGIERHLFAFYEQPELMHRINEDLTDFNLRVIEAIGAVCSPDFMTFAEDMSFNRGPMLSQALFEEFMTPYYRRVVPALTQRGIVPLVDTDGDVTMAAPWFEAAGIEGILPLERQAGVDIARLRADHPTMKFIGHFDKMTMNQGEAAMRAEFERLLPTAAGGGFFISCDHQTPPGVSYEDYWLYLRLFAEYGAEAGRRSRERQMAPVE